MQIDMGKREAHIKKECIEYEEGNFVMALQPWWFGMSVLLSLGLVCVSDSTAREEASQEIARFESDILPIFEAKCLACHGEKLQQNGLDLRTRESVLKGGESGPAVEPGSGRRESAVREGKEWVDAPGG